MSLPSAIPRGVLVEVRTGSVYDADEYLFESKGPGGQVYWPVFWDPDKTGEHYLNHEADKVAPSERQWILKQGHGIHGATMLIVVAPTGATEFVRAFQLIRRQLQGTPAVAPTSAGEIGKSIIRWGQGQGPAAVAQTVRRTSTLTQKAVRQMIRKGLTRQWVEKQLSLYGNALETGNQKLRNTQLLPRRELMEKILEPWPN